MVLNAATRWFAVASFNTSHQFFMTSSTGCQYVSGYGYWSAFNVAITAFDSVHGISSVYFNHVCAGCQHTSHQFFMTSSTGCQYVSGYCSMWLSLPLTLSTALVQPTSTMSVWLSDTCWFHRPRLGRQFPHQSSSCLELASDTSALSLRQSRTIQRRTETHLTSQAHSWLLWEYIF